MQSYLCFFPDLFPILFLCPLLSLAPQGLHSREAALGNTPPPTIRYVGVAGRVFSLPPLLAQPPNSPADVRLPSSWFPEPSFCWLITNLFCRETGQPAAACPALSCVCRCRALPEGAALTHWAMLWQGLETWKKKKIQTLSLIIPEGSQQAQLKRDAKMRIFLHSFSFAWH